MRGEARDAADRGVLVPVRLASQLPIDFRAVHTTDMDGWGEIAQSRLPGPRKAFEAKLGPPRKAAAVAPRPRGARTHICVMPFANMSGDPEQDYFSDGITEDIITDLGKVSALSIVSRNMAFSFKGAKDGVGEIGRQTKATYVLAGSVRKAGDRVRITAQLINATNEAQVWAERYDRDLNDIFALQDEISRRHRCRAEADAPARGKTRARAARDEQRRGLQVVPDGAPVQRHGQRAPPVGDRPALQACGRTRPVYAAPGRPWASRRATCTVTAPRIDTGRCGGAARALDPNLADAHAALGAC